LKPTYRNKRFSLQGLSSVVLGAGDDAAVISLGGNRVLVTTTDILVENTHFNLSWDRVVGSKKRLYHKLGYKSLAVNLSDLAAMGAVKPLFCLVGLGLPGDTPVDNVDNLYKGVINLANKYNVKVVGGDTSLSKHLMITITLIGEAKKDEIVKRSGAKIGDKIYVTGNLGDSAAGLEILKSRRRHAATNSRLVNKHLQPPVRIREANLIAKYITGMIDCSDGLILSAKLIAKESRVGIKIDMEKVPVSKQLQSYAKKKKKRALDYTISGGEDYELIFTSSSRKVAQILPGSKEIGEVLPKSYGVKFYSGGKEFNIKHSGFNHFKWNS
jgi:thiamine-monophosphate kinase